MWRLFTHCVLPVVMLLSTQLARAADDYRALSPASPPPHPAVLLVPGCSGFTALNGHNVYEQRATKLVAAGYFVVFVDYLGRFGNCGRISHAQVSDAIVEAATWARNQAGVDPTRIAVIGCSYGGGGVIAALRTMPTGSTPLLAKAVMYYPDCRGEISWSDSSCFLLAMTTWRDPSYAKPSRGALRQTAYA